MKNLTIKQLANVSGGNVIIRRPAPCTLCTAK
ncbi:MAG: bacteriocin [Planctomycetaceae bacterium]|nr:bacteriocin [Planctomycetaceae bacterium]